MQHDIAVVGMVCRVPGADDTASFWEMLATGKEGLRPLSPAEMQKMHVTQQQNYIAAGGYIDGIDLFDADLFAYNAREAAMMDPQHRLWLQACWQALEVTGHAGRDNRCIGVFASAGPNAYLKQMLLHQDNPEQHQAALLGNVPDCLATRVSYVLNLTGPSMTLQCGCSSSLVGLHQARLALLAKQCDAALVGGICITIPHHQGYTYIEGGFASPDGHCRPFSADAAGTVFSSGYGVVVVKRLADAVADGDCIYAVIKGSAINNDGSDKASFTAPSVNGQAAVIAKALRVARLTAQDIQYIEAHGTATPIGDPIELTALTQAFLQSASELNTTYTIGSVKANVGHLDVAAGIISFIKTCLMLHHKTFVPQIHFKDWNTKCVSTAKHFSINTKQQHWDANGKRRAGVSAFGFGGTNAHVIVEEAPEVAASTEKHPMISRLIVLSAKSSRRLQQWIDVLRGYLQVHPDTAIEELAFTLQTGRSQLPYRFLVSVDSVNELISILGRVTEADFVVCPVKSDVFEVNGKTLHAIQQAWLSGYQLNWKDAYRGLIVKKMVLPPAPLLQESYWIETAPKNADKQQISVPIQTSAKKALYQAVWQQQIVSASVTLESMQPVMVVSCGNELLTSQLVAYLAEKNIAYYLVNPQLEQEWDVQPLPLSCVISMDITELNAASAYPANVLFTLAKQNKLIRHLKQLSTLVIGMTQLQHHHTQPLLSLLVGLNRGIGQEFPHLNTQLIDLDSTEAVTQLNQAIKSICSPELNDLCVWRDHACWQQSYQLQPETASVTGYFKKHGIYLITGGLGDVASVHVDFLAKEYQATLILTGRSSLPDVHDWPAILNHPNTDKKLRQKLVRMQQWKSAGFDVHAYGADITDLTQMRALCQQLMAKWGRIDGIIHCAGAGSDMHYKILTELSWEHCWQLFAPKLLGIENIAALADEVGIKNCLMISSISSALTGIGLSAYGASHNLLDAIVRKHYPHWRIMNWDAWHFYQDEQNKQHGDLGSEMDKLAIKPEQGLAILRYAFSIPDWQQFFVSLADLPARHRYWAQRGFLEKMNTSSIKHPRPALLIEYAAPVTRLEQQLAATWQLLLGIDKVGIHDNFFELGGHSLLAIEFANCLQTEFNYTCSVVELFEAPTIAQLANRIEQTGIINHSVMSNVNDRVSKQLAARRAFQSGKEMLHV